MLRMLGTSASTILLLAATATTSSGIDVTISDASQNVISVTADGIASKTATFTKPVTRDGATATIDVTTTLYVAPRGDGTWSIALDTNAVGREAQLLAGLSRCLATVPTPPGGHPERVRLNCIGDGTAPIYATISLHAAP